MAQLLEHLTVSKATTVTPQEAAWEARFWGQEAISSVMDSLCHCETSQAAQIHAHLATIRARKATYYALIALGG